MLDLDIRFEDTQLYRDLTDPLLREIKEKDSVIERQDSVIKSAVKNLHKEGRSDEDVAAFLGVDVKVVFQILGQLDF